MLSSSFVEEEHVPRLVNLASMWVIEPVSRYWPESSSMERQGLVVSSILAACELARSASTHKQARTPGAAAFAA